MSNMKCPVCNVLLDECGDLLCCPNDHCAWVGNKELWQELICTHKALDVAVDALKELKPQKAKGGGYWAVKSTDAIKLINTALEQITALEQKENKI